MVHMDTYVVYRMPNVWFMIPVTSRQSLGLKCIEMHCPELPQMVEGNIYKETVGAKYLVKKL